MSRFGSLHCQISTLEWCTEHVCTHSKLLPLCLHEVLHPGMCSGSRKECFQLFVHKFNMLWMYLMKPNMFVHSLTFITGTSNSCGQFPRNAQGLLWLHLTSYHKDIWKHMALVVTSQALSQKVAIWTLFLSNKC